MRDKPKDNRAITERMELVCPCYFLPTLSIDRIGKRQQAIAMETGKLVSVVPSVPMVQGSGFKVQDHLNPFPDVRINEVVPKAPNPPIVPDVRCKCVISFW